MCIIFLMVWDTLKTRRDVKDVSMWYKIQNHHVHLPFPPTVRPKSLLNYTDHPQAYLHIRPRIDVYKHSFFVRTIPLWNSLPTSAIFVSTPHSFQQLALDHLRVQPRVRKIYAINMSPIVLSVYLIFLQIL